jgi:hypothetical protein
MSNNMIRVDSNNHWICVDSSNHCNSVDSSKICRIAREKKTVGQHFYTGAPASVSPKTPQATCGLSRNLRRSSSALATSREGHRSPRSDLGGQHQGCYADAEPLHSRSLASRGFRWFCLAPDPVRREHHARAASGHAAALPMSVISSRRFIAAIIRSPRRRARAPSVTARARAPSRF